MSKSIFAPFYDEDHQQQVFDDLVKMIPKKHQFQLYLFMGMFDSTRREGYRRDKEKQNDNQRP